MNQPRHDLLADAALAGDQNLGVRARGVMNFFFDPPNGGTDAYHCHCLVHVEPQLTKKSLTTPDMLGNIPGKSMRFV